METPSRVHKSRSKALKTRSKVRHSKTRTGCRTCKRRRVKCDEVQPACKRCIQGRRQCEGYEPPPKAWLFEPSQLAKVRELRPSVPKHTNGADETQTGQLAHSAPLIHQEGGVTKQRSSACPICGKPLLNSSCTGSCALKEAAMAAESQRNIANSIPGPYRVEKAQQYLKYFMEIVGKSFARAKLSAEFWLLRFPQLAWQSDPTRYILCAMSATFQSRARNILTRSRDTTIEQEAITLESKAMKLVVMQDSTLEETLASSLGFCMTSMFAGDYQRALHHNLFTQKIISEVSDPSEHDLHMLQYCGSLSRAFLQFFRTTRGPCRIHAGEDLARCEPACFTLEESSLELRVADGLHHLRRALPMIEYCRLSLDKRDPRHKHHEVLVKLLDIYSQDCKMLIEHWGDSGRVGLSNLTKLDLATVPYTMSPFDPLFNDLVDTIELGDQTPSNFKEFELRMQVTIPSLIVATSRGYPPVHADIGCLSGTPAMYAKKMMGTI